MERAAGRSVRQFEGLWKLRQIKVEGETLELLEVVEICVRDRWLDVLDGVAKGEEKTLDKRGVLVLELATLDFGERVGFFFFFLVFILRMV